MEWFFSRMGEILLSHSYSTRVVLRVSPRVEVYLPHGVWGEKGFFPTYLHEAGWEYSPYPDALLGLMVPRVVGRG
jgi:hypothetical protein